MSQSCRAIMIPPHAIRRHVGYLVLVLVGLAEVIRQNTQPKSASISSRTKLLLYFRLYWMTASSEVRSSFYLRLPCHNRQLDRLRTAGLSKLVKRIDVARTNQVESLAKWGINWSDLQEATGMGHSCLNEVIVKGCYDSGAMCLDLYLRCTGQKALSREWSAA